MFRTIYDRYIYYQSNMLNDTNVILLIRNQQCTHMPRKRGKDREEKTRRQIDRDSQTETEKRETDGQ